MGARITVLLRGLAILAAALAIAPQASAQNYPTRQIRLIVPFAAGGPADLLGRVIADEMSKDLGQQVFVDNRPGANTIIGAEYAAKADPDGYTLLMAIDGTLVMNPFLYSKLSYDPFKDFAPITLIARVPSVIEARPEVPANTIPELIALEKAKPGGLLMGYSTPTSQVSIELLNKAAGVKFALVPYKGGATQVTALLGGEIPLGHESLNVALPFARDGKLKIIALTARERTPIAPEIPTIAETYPGFDLGIWQGIVAPTKTPAEIITKLHDEIVAVLKRDSVRNKLLTAGIEPATSSSPADFATFMRSQADVRSKIIESIGLKLD
ncbi:MAG TPA: tripartite tricarboxylate transporter substrate binding protein [Xanthobacteraceae bacterium]|jgi:tripartite-type tricarboxylate transporter receptor subunit TctC|nr:tripartite tricarboxylate transporter substrate binding protein [Xanthobacteraceae bacterium]